MKGRLYDACIKTMVLHGIEMWTLNAEDKRRLKRNESSMFHRMCNVSVHVYWSTSVLRELLRIRGIRCVQERRLNWFGYMI